MSIVSEFSSSKANLNFDAKLRIFHGICVTICLHNSEEHGTAVYHEYTVVADFFESKTPKRCQRSYGPYDDSEKTRVILVKEYLLYTLLTIETHDDQTIFEGNFHTPLQLLYVSFQ